MSRFNIIPAALACALVLLADRAWAGKWPDDCTQSTLPSGDPDYPDDQLILTCLPSHFNGALIVYAHGYVRPQEPLSLPAEFRDGDVRGLVERLLNLGFGFATSSYHKNGYAVEQAEADLNNLVDYVTASQPDVDAVYVVGPSEGGLMTTMLVEKYPETYAGGLAMCGPLAGIRYQIGYLADVRVLFDYFYPQVFPFGALEVPDDAHEQWDGPNGFKERIAAAIDDDPDGIAQVFDSAGVACNTGDHADAANCGQDILAYSVFGTNDLLRTAGGWPVSNRGKSYRDTEDDAALNAGVGRFDADPAARAYANRYYRPSGLLRRPLVTLHTTRDPGVPFRHELKYFARAALLDRDEMLTVLPVDRAGHCAFTPQEVLGGLGALLLKADSDLALALAGPLAALHDVIDLGDGAGRVAQLVQRQARDLVDEVDRRFGFLGNGVKDALGAGQELGDQVKAKIGDLF
jgi:hypothetical protein